MVTKKFATVCTGPDFTSKVTGILPKYPGLQSLLEACISQGMSQTHLSPLEVDELKRAAHELRISAYQFGDYLGTIYTKTDLRLPRGSALSKKILPLEELPIKEVPAKVQVASTPPVVQPSHEVRVEEIICYIKSQFSDLIKAGKFSEGQIAALAETCSRVPKETYESAKDKFAAWPVEKFYAWAMANSNIVFPYLTLGQAEKNINSAKVSAARNWSWGIRDGKVHLPKSESVETDSNSWTIIREICLQLFGEDKVFNDYDQDSSVPPLTNTFVVNDPTAGYVLVRILELMRSPGTATIRTGSKLNQEALIKNQIDFVVLESRYQASEVYKNLSISGTALGLCRRTEKVEKSNPRGKAEFKTILTGYKLAETLQALVPTKSKGVPEEEPFSRLILELLKQIAKTCPDNQEMPSVFFANPAHLLRNELRKGPVIKTKAGVKSNLYIPFSYVKSQECTQMPEPLKRDIVSVGTDILRNIDHINKLSISNASRSFPFYERYIKASYALSDECRKRWRLSGLVPSIRELKSILIKDKEYFSILDEEVLQEIETAKLQFESVVDDPAELIHIMESVEKEIKRKKDSRVRSTR